MNKALLLALLLSGCVVVPDGLVYDCHTDTECEQLCVEELREDEDPAVCAISLAPVNN
jgi:starvation-inducible outer membrane lipoprotein